MLLDGKGILADRRPPDVLKGASTPAMDTLDLVGANDDVLERTTVLDLEHSVRVTAFRLAGTRDTAVVRLVATIKGLARSDSVDLFQDRRAGRLGKGRTLLDVTRAGGRRDHGVWGGDGTDGQGGDEK